MLSVYIVDQLTRRDGLQFGVFDSNVVQRSGLQGVQELHWAVEHPQCIQLDKQLQLIRQKTQLAQGRVVNGELPQCIVTAIEDCLQYIAQVGVVFQRNVFKRYPCREGGNGVHRAIGDREAVEDLLWEIDRK